MDFKTSQGIAQKLGKATTTIGKVMHSNFLLGLDMGGTHTDAVLWHKGQLLAHIKVCTDQNNLIASSSSALAQLLKQASIKPAEVSRITLGTTLLVNALVQNKTQAVGLVLSAGPGRDPSPFKLGATWAQVQGGLDHRGQELVPMRKQEVKQHIQVWQDQVSAFACVGKFSPRNNQHEQMQAQIIGEILPKAFVSQGHSFGGELNFPRRIATAYWNSAIAHLQHQFASAITQSLAQLSFTSEPRLLKADGGSLTLNRSLHFPIEALISGPAASIMGMLAMLTGEAAKQDYLLLDMGGTTTDLAVLAQGQPILSSSGLSIKGRPTLVRALQSLSIALGGDTLVKVKGKEVSLGPERLGPALAFGGSQPTLLDCLNVLQLAQAGQVEASLAGLQKFADPQSIARQVIAQAQQKLKIAAQDLLAEVNQRPVYTLDALLHPQPVRPQQIILVGGPAKVMAPLVEEALGLPVLVPPMSEVSNALGAALTRPTANLDLFADTLTGKLHIPSLGIIKNISKRYTLDEAKAEACANLLASLQAESEKTGQNNAAHPELTSNQLNDKVAWQQLPIDITEATSFSTLDGYDYGGKDLRVSCQLRPGLVSSFTGE